MCFPTPRAFGRAILVPGKLSYALLLAEVSPHCFCGPSLLPPPAYLGAYCLLHVGHLSPLFLLGFQHLEFSPSAVTGPIQDACEDMAESDIACYLGRCWKSHPGLTLLMGNSSRSQEFPGDSRRENKTDSKGGRSGSSCHSQPPGRFEGQSPMGGGKGACGLMEVGEYLVNL